MGSRVRRRSRSRRTIKDTRRFMMNSEDLGYVHQYTGISFYRLRTVKATRVDHICQTCQQTIPAGSSSAYHSGKDPQMGFYHYHQCMTCYEEATQWQM